jgi:hypothetical protein
MAHGMKKHQLGLFGPFHVDSSDSGDTPERWQSQFGLSVTVASAIQTR